MELKIFGPDKYKKYAANAIGKQYQRTDVAVTTVDNGVIAIDDKVVTDVHSTAYGVFDADGNFVNESLQYHKRKAQYVPPMPSGEIPYIDLPVIYMGNVHDAFGHFLLKHMNRGWMLADEKYRGIKVALINDRHINPLPKFISQFEKLLGVEFIIVDKTTRFKRVYVPSQTFNFYTYWAPELSRVYEYIADGVAGKKYDKIYLSRAKMNVRAPFGEKKIQNIFKKNGFHIVYPETLTLAEQISLMKNCRVLAGCGGTALHLALFMPHGGTVIQLKRNTEFKDNIALQYMVCAAKNINLIGVWASVEKKKTDWSSNLPQIIGLTKYLKSCLDFMGCAYDDADGVPDSEEFREYNQQIKMFIKGRAINKLKRKFIHFTAAFIPFSGPRSRYVANMKKILRVKSLV